MANWKFQWAVILQIIFSGLASSLKSNTQSEAPSGMSFGQSSWLAKSLCTIEVLMGSCTCPAAQGYLVKYAFYQCSSKVLKGTLLEILIFM